LLAHQRALEFPEKYARALGTEAHFLLTYALLKPKMRADVLGPTPACSSATDSNEFGVLDVKSSEIGASSNAPLAKMAHSIADFGSRIAD
jgi:hypothetical protein